MSDRRRQRARALLGSVVGVLVTLSLLTGAPVSAHEGDDGGGGTTDSEDSAAHAEEDLAGRSMGQIERDTKASAARLKANGDAPRALSPAATGAKVPSTYSTSGGWGAVVDTDVVPVFQAVLPNGQVLVWDSVGDSGTLPSPAGPKTPHTYTRAAVLNPYNNTSHRVDLQGFNIFCAGFTQLPSGDVLVVGGNLDNIQEGIRQTHVFHWQTETWSRGPDMSAARWYPSVVALGNGESVIVGGGPGTAEVYQADGTLRRLTGFVGYAARVYPFLIARDDGRVELVGPNTQSQTLTTAGTGSLDYLSTRDGIFRDFGSFATYAPGKTLVSGGGRVTEGGLSNVPTRTARIVDTTGRTTTYSSASSMAYPRKQHNLTVLPDGSVLATGGMSTATDPLVDLDHPVQVAERWDPDTDRWTTLAAAARPREYHSAATLLPDGRVLTGGGGVCVTCVAKGYLEKNVEIFYPPYLFDGNAAAPRPTLSDVPGAIDPGGTFTARWGNAATIKKLALIRLGDATHSVDQGQRYIPLDFTADPAAKTLRITAPADGNAAPPGYYMLFAINAAGTPSVAALVRVNTDEGRRNLAFGRPSAAASALSYWSGASRANDGRASTGWYSTGATNQWWSVDLGTLRQVDTVQVSWDKARPSRYEVQTSVLGKKWTTVAAGAATVPGTQRLSFPPWAARYVRIVEIAPGANTGISINEVKVFAR